MAPACAQVDNCRAVPVQPRPSTAGEPLERGARTRAAILDAAETVFAQHGYARARLEDVAARVGIRRASIVYHFRDKPELYEAVLAGVFGELLRRYERALAEPRPLPQRLEAIVDAWVSFVGERPVVARLLLWEAAEASRTSIAAPHIAPLIDTVRAAIVSGQRQRMFRAVDPVHFIFGIVGATVFFTAAPGFAPELRSRPLDRVQLDLFRREILGITRRLLGSGERPAIAGRITNDAAIRASR
jgi:TetR/AcrR family transcriptional regulator